MCARVRVVLATAHLSSTLPTAAPPVDPPSAAKFALLPSEDARLAAIGYQLLTANAAFCRELQPEMGWALQAIDQFDAPSRTAARAAFGFERAVAVETVGPHGPAARAGVSASDSTPPGSAAGC